MMKKKLIAMAVMVCAAGALTSCDDEKTSPEETAPKETDLKEVVAPELVATEPSAEDVQAQLLPLLADYPAAHLEQVQLDATPAETGELLLAVRVMVNVAENLYSREAAPEALNDERRAVNEAMNRAMMPESVYLLQVGARIEEIREEDRKPRELPAELARPAEEMKTMAEQPVYYLRMPERTTMELAATMTTRRQGGQWEFSEVHFDTAPLASLLALVPESALPKDAAVVNEGFEARLRKALREKIDAFNSAAESYIKSREETARQRVVQLRSREEENARAEAEKLAQKEAAREQWNKLCSSVLKDGTSFTGEWKRGDAFGKISLRVAKVQSFPDSVQFTGTITDPGLPQAELHVVGRLEQPARMDALVPMVVRIYNGRYDPDVPTAEVFDAQDAVMKLRMAQDGSAQGVLSCDAWKDSPEKDFLISLAPKKQGGKPQKRK